MRESWPHGTTCYMVATDFLLPVESQAFLPAGYPANYANCLADPVCNTMDYSLPGSSVLGLFQLLEPVLFV